MTRPSPNFLLVHCGRSVVLLAVAALAALSACAADSTANNVGDDGGVVPDGFIADTAGGDGADPTPAPDGDTDPTTGPDPTAVAERLAAASVQTYRETLEATPDVATCSPEQPASGASDACTGNDACGDGLVCRNVRVFGLDSRCGCVPDAGCDSIACSAGEVCLPGTRSAQELCGGGLGTALCGAACVQGDCTSDDECGADERCVVVRDVCRNLQGTACTHAAGTGCLGNEGACGADEACLPTLSGDWVCSARGLNCD